MNMTTFFDAHDLLCAKVTNLINFTMRAVRGYFRAELLPVAGVSIVCILAGLWIGTRLSRRMSGDVARQVVIIRQAPPSRNMPIMSRTRLHSIRNTNLLLVKFSMAVATILGMLTQLRYWPPRS